MMYVLLFRDLFGESRTRESPSVESKSEEQSLRALHVSDFYRFGYRNRSRI